jgi:hypothetical protein
MTLLASNSNEVTESCEILSANFIYEKPSSQLAGFVITSANGTSLPSPPIEESWRCYERYASCVEDLGYGLHRIRSEYVTNPIEPLFVRMHSQSDEKVPETRSKPKRKTRTTKLADDYKDKRKKERERQRQEARDNKRETFEQSYEK